VQFSQFAIRYKLWIADLKRAELKSELQTARTSIKIEKQRMRWAEISEYPSPNPTPAAKGEIAISPLEPLECRAVW